MRVRLMSCALFLAVGSFVEVAAAAPGPSARLTGIKDADVDELGAAVAMVKDYVAIGAPGPELDGGGVHLFRYVDKKGWLADGQLTMPADTERFGSAVAFAGPDVLIAGAEYTGATAAVGAVYVFKRAGTGWKESQTLAPDSTLDVAFGHALATSGNDLAVGVQGTTSDYDVEIWTTAAGSYSRTAKLPHPTTYEAFGVSVALLGDTAVVGAPEADAGSARKAGAVYVFTRTAGTWTLAQKVVAPTPVDGAHFGWSVALGSKRLAIGAPDEEIGAITPGRAYVFEKSGGSFVAMKDGAVAGTTDLAETGYAVALGSGDGTLIVGAHGAGKDGEGQAKIYVYDGTSFVEREKLSPVSSVLGMNYGAAAAMAGDDAVIGAANQFGAGAAYVFRPLLAIADGKACTTDPECEHGHCFEGTCCAVASCAPFSCASGSCSSTCTATNGCASTAYCDGTTCKPLQPNGSACNDKKQCASGLCEGSFCCEGACLPYVCAETGKCKVACAAATDCAKGFVCTAGVCVQGSRCNDDKSASIGKDEVVTACAPFKCVDGACLKRCGTSVDCQSGFACDTATSTCVATGEAPAVESGAGCAVGASGASPVGLSVLVGLGLAGAVRARRRR